MRLLLVGPFAGKLQTGLDHLGYRCTTAGPEEAPRLLASRDFGAVVVDCDTPGALEFLAGLRRDAPGTVAVAVTAAPDVATSIEVLRGGDAALALDYVIDKAEDAIIRRIDSALSGHFRYIQRGGFRADLDAYRAYYNDALLPLVGREIDLFITFMRFPNRNFLYVDLAREVLGERLTDEEAYEALRSPMSRLRKALKKAVGRDVLTRHDAKYGIRFVPVGRVPRSAA